MPVSLKLRLGDPILFILQYEKELDSALFNSEGKLKIALKTDSDRKNLNFTIKKEAAPSCTQTIFYGSLKLTKRTCFGELLAFALVGVILATFSVLIL